MLFSSGVRESFLETDSSDPQLQGQRGKMSPRRRGGPSVHFTDKEEKGQLVRVSFTFTPLVSRLGRGRDGKSRRSALALLILFTALFSLLGGLGLWAGMRTCINTDEAVLCPVRV